MTETAPYGSWRSPLSLDLLSAGVTSFREIQLDVDAIFWLEGRPKAHGRQVLVRWREGQPPEDVSPPELNVRNRVHEYGGGAYVADRGQVVFSSFGDGRLYRVVADGLAEPLTAERAWRYADLTIDRPRDRLLCIREDHSDPSREAVNTLAAVSLTSGACRVLERGKDFYSSPRLGPDGGRLAWLSWNHPNMPWDGTQLWVAEVLANGSLGDRQLVAGGDEVWVSQPRWAPDGTLHFACEVSGWANVYRWRGGEIEPVVQMDAEFVHPDWVFGLSTYGFDADGRVVAIGRFDGHDHLLAIAVDGRATELDVPFTEMEYLRVAGTTAFFVGGGPAGFSSPVRLDLASGRWTSLRPATEIELDPADVTIGQPIEFTTNGDRPAHAIYYPPHNRAFSGPPDERPPLVVTSHGGPTSAASTALSVAPQLFASRGFAVLDVNYGGSTGYGRDYRRRLEGTWGVTDVADCVAGAQHLVAAGLADRDRTAIRGGSAGGYTTLAALAFRDEFRAGVSYFGIGDLVTFVRHTHKFESRYLDRLVGPYPAAADLYRERSPLSAADHIACPVLILQGLDDRIVPPAQAEEIVDSLRANRVPFAYLAFEGEDHGFRQAENITRSFAAELSFFGQLFGFTVADAIEPIEIEGLEEWRKRRTPGSVRL